MYCNAIYSLVVCSYCTPYIQDEDDQQDPPKRTKQANQYFWRRHYLSIIQETSPLLPLNWTLLVCDVIGWSTSARL